MRARALGVTAVVGILALGGLAACGNDDDVADAVGEVDGVVDDLATDGCEPVEQLPETRPSIHVLTEEADFDHHPPTWGPHRSVFPEPGVRDEPMPEVDQVAALELGLVILHYEPEAVPAEGVAALAAVAENRGAILTPAASPVDGGYPVAFTAWERRQRCEDVSMTVAEAAEAFVERFAGATSNDG